MGKTLLYFLILFLSTSVGAVPLSPQGITLQGTILTPTGLPEEGASVAFTIQIRSPASSDCLLYSESHILNMTGSGGAFSINIGSGTRSGSGFHSTSTLAQVFNNASAAITPLTCGSGGGSFTPSSGDSRVVKITFDDGSGPQTLSQNLNVQAVPYALYADTLEGKSSSDFIQVNTSSGKALSQANLESVFASSANLTELLALIGGTSTQYTALSGSPSFAGSVTAGGGLFGSAASGGDLTLESTSHSTKGDILIAPNGGNVGIGNSTPTAKLDVSGSGKFSGGLSANSFGLPNPDATYSSWVGLDANYNTQFFGKLSGSDYFYIGGNGTSENASLIIGTGDNATEDIAFHTGLASGNPTGSEAVRIKASNNSMGIGTTNPTARLHVIGANSSSGAAPNALTVVGGTGAAASAGGGISLTSGAGNTTGAAGTISITGGNGGSSAAGGALSFIGGLSGLGGNTGTVTMRSGHYDNGVSPAGGATIFLGASGSVTSGSVSISSGGVSGQGPGGSGSVSILTPNAAGGVNSPAGNISITAGNGDGTDIGGTINITAGSGGASNINGSNIVLNGGAKGGTGLDGFVVLADARGKVGVGTSNPSEKLHVNGNILATSGDLRAYTSGSASVYAGYGANYIFMREGNPGLLASYQGMRLLTNSATVAAMDITTTGNVGIGTSSPAAKLDVNGTMKLAKNGSAPFACDATKDAVIALTSQYTTCVCKGGTTSWVLTADGISACSW